MREPDRPARSAILVVGGFVGGKNHVNLGHDTKTGNIDQERQTRVAVAGTPNENGSLVQRAIQAVSDHIRAHNLRVGDTLPGEQHFAQELGVSRAVMREAFGALGALRLIDVGNGRRPRVSAMDGSVIGASLDQAVSTAQITLPEIWDVRRTIELRTAALAAARRTEKQADEILRLADAMACASKDPDELSRCDIDFHEEIARASHNALFIEILRAFSSLLKIAVPAAWRTRTSEEERREALASHKTVAIAISSRDPEAASAGMNQHFETTIRVIFPDDQISKVEEIASNHGTGLATRVLSNGRTSSNGQKSGKGDDDRLNEAAPTGNMALAQIAEIDLLRRAVVDLTLEKTLLSERLRRLTLQGEL